MTGSSGPVGRPVERRTVSRKTPGDGKLEITKEAASRIEPLGASFPVRVDDQPGEGTIATMPCTCRGGDRPHVHYFVESPLFKALTAGAEVELSIEGGERLNVRRLE